jgi:hypothetical protein
MSPLREFRHKDERLNSNNVIKQESKDEVYRNYSKLFTYTIAQYKDPNNTSNGQ